MDPSGPGSASRLAQAGAAGVGLLAVGALAGWETSHLDLAAASSGFVPMAPNTALAFLAIAIALWARSAPGGALRVRVARGLGLLVVLLGMVTVLDWVFGGGASGVNQIVIDGRRLRGTLEIGVMSLYTAAAFVPLGAALTLDSRSRAHRTWRNALASIAALVGTLFLLGYALGAPLLYADPAIPLALTTALAFVLAGVGTLALAPHDAWPVHLVVGDGVHARLLRAFLPMLVLVVVLQSWLESFIARAPQGRAPLATLIAGSALLIGSFIVARIAVSIGAGIERAQTAANAARDALHRAEAQLARAQKMEAIGRLAGGVAHDFNNMLSVIISQTDLLLDRRGIAGQDREALLEISLAAQRSAELSRQLLAVSRRQVLEPAIVDVDELIGGMVLMLERLVGDDVRITTRLQTGTARVRADAAQLEQVLMNLVVNARDAMPSGGTIAIETSADDDGVELVVRDTGSGMDDETQSRIFEPFFSTKGAAQGSGLGLSIVHGVVEQSGGHISVHSELGRGATFRITLPTSDGAASSAKIRSLAPAEGDASETLLLLVEDEPLVRRAARRILAGAGYRVIEAGSAVDALAASRAHEGPLHAVVTDLVMPGMNGQALIAALRRERPEIASVLMSGYTNDASIDRATLHKDTIFVQKPFDAPGLVAALKKALDRRRLAALGSAPDRQL